MRLRLWRRLALWAGLMACGGAGAIQAVSEERLKLAYLFNFAQFIEWPAELMPPGSPLRLCLLGADPFGVEADALTARRVRSHPIVVLRPTRISELQGCHLVYVSNLDAQGFSRNHEALRRTGMLVVSGDEGALRRGATIQFVVQDKRLRWHLDHEQARNLGLTVSVKLVELSLPPPAP
ncbi:YfiR family protein [Inhella sp.]|uniref:YfiR family protein n=1 Tax=Inhella sp. TaxID=1921806 RepID=UPI0035B0AD05